VEKDCSEKYAVAISAGQGTLNRCATLRAGAKAQPGVYVATNEARNRSKL
jgi:hypothetical protein